MSSFLGFESYLIPLGSTVENVKDTLVTAITNYGWRCVRKSLPVAAVLGTILNPGNALDGNSITTAGDSSAFPKNVGLQMVAAFTPTVMYLQGDTTTVTNSPKNFTLDYSDDGTTWTTLQTWANESNWTFFERRRYTVTGAAAHTYWRLNVTANNGGTYNYIYGWELENAAGWRACNYVYAEFIPPVTETIGNSFAREQVRLTFTSGVITIRPVQEILQPVPQIHTIYSIIAGAVTASITISGQTVSFTGIAGNTTYQNGRGLYEALRASSQSNFLAYNFSYVGYSGVILATLKTPAANVAVFTAANCTASIIGSYTPPQEQWCGLVATNSVSVDLVNGFVYYLQVNSRSLGLATKTNASYYGVVHACYGDNASALAQVPASGCPVLNNTPIELVVGYDSATITNTDSTGSVSHLWGAPNTWTWTGVQTIDNATYGAACPWWSRAQPFGMLDMSSGTNYGGTISEYQGKITLKSDGAFTGPDSGTIYNVHRMVMDPDPGWVAGLQQSGSQNTRVVAPVYSNLDWYHYTGTLNSEQMILVPHTDFQTTMAADAGLADATINVASTTGFPASGYLVIEGEVLQYSGVTSTSFTGCTRAKYATTAQSHYTGTLVQIGAWMVKINTGLLFAGYQKPA